MWHYRNRTTKSVSKLQESSARDTSGGIEGRDDMDALVAGDDDLPRDNNNHIQKVDIVTIYKEIQRVREVANLRRN